jgi:hypothetical protein
MEQLILKFITDRFGDYKTCVEDGYLIVHDGMYVVGVLIYGIKQFNYQQHIQGSIMDMFDLTIDQVNWYMKRWVAHTFNEDVLNTDGVFGHE